jgi:hypothetical protein
MGFFDDIVSDFVAPPWLQQGAYGRGPGIGGRYLQTIGIELDAIALRAKQAANISLPGLGDPSQLPFLGSDRLLWQGPSEPNAAFVVRLSGAFDAWAYAGSDWALLGQTLPELLPVAPPMFVVSDTSTWSYYPAGATGTTPPITARIQPPNWNWDGAAVDAHLPGLTAWWRSWLVIFSAGATTWATAGPTLGTGGQPVLGNSPNWSLGFSNVPPVFWINLRRQLAVFRAAQSWIRHIIISLDATHFQIDKPAGGGINPDGTFGLPYAIVGGVYVASRFPTARYVPGSPAP